MAKNTQKPLVDKRRRAFKKALVDEGITVTEFARRLDVHRVHVNRSFREPASAGQRIHDAVDALIAKHSRRRVSAA